MPPDTPVLNESRNATGCNSKSGSAPDAGGVEKYHEGDGLDHSKGEHSHRGGANGGHLIELGSDEAFHAELIHDDTTHRVSIIIPGGKAAKNGLKGSASNERFSAPDDFLK